MAVATSDAQSIERGYQRLSSLFRPQVREGKKCHRCKTEVYHAEKIGPINGVVFHKTCFKCVVCGQFLSMKNYWSNQVDPDDREVYCKNHVPRIGGTKIDETSIGIKNAIQAQKGYVRMSKKLNPEVRVPGTLRGPSYNYEAIAIKRAASVPKPHDFGPETEGLHKGAAIDKDAMYIKGPIEAQLLRQGYQRKLDKHHYPPNIYKKRKQLIDAQKRLEEEHRREEDHLMDELIKTRKTEARRLSDELKKEWEVKLKDLTERFDREMEKKKKKMKDSDKKLMTIHFENQKKEIEVVIEEKKKKKKESMTLRLKEKEQRQTATMVTRQSKQMLEMLANKQEELKTELQQELESEVKVDVKNEVNGQQTTEEIEEALEALEIAPVAPKELPPPHPPSCRKKDLFPDPKVFHDVDEQTITVAENEQPTYTDLVQQLTENLVTDLEKVRAIYRWITVKDLNVMEFEEVLETDTPMGLLRGIKAGSETYHVLFMRLCRICGNHFVRLFASPSGLEVLKADLAHVKRDRTFHIPWIPPAYYAGLHCVEIKGHSKSVGYEPGMKIQPEAFQNTWNAVLVDGDWRLVQCNWGARHLVLNKDKRSKEKPQKPQPKKSKDQIRYQYDDHYFLTDPDEFIQEFWAQDPDWQLLENPITLEEFECLPFVRSIFFHYGMHFDRGMMSVLEASEKGAIEIKVKVPEDLENDLVFYYQMRFAEKEKKHEATYRSANLERFIFQTMVDNTVMFSIHVPTPGDYFFEVFANKLEESNRISPNGDDSQASISPFRLKCACKFKVSCKTLTGKMHPLPDCASGEWGPQKGMRHFGLKMLSIKRKEKEQSVPKESSTDNTSDQLSDSGSSGGDDPPDNPKAGILNVENMVQLKFRTPRPLHFVARLRMNQVEGKVLEPFVHLEEKDSIVTLTISPPQIGQYGLDIFARPKEASENTTLSHAFKYLINCLKVAKPVEIPKLMPKLSSKRDKWGPLPQFDELGLKVISPKDPKMTCNDSNQVIEMFVPDNVHISHQFLKEPDDEVRGKVTMMKDDKDSRKVKYYINLPQTGNYMLCLFARKSDDDTMPNVYNFLIVYKKTVTETNGTGTKTEERRGSSIFKKSLFKKSDKDKDKSK